MAPPCVRPRRVSRRCPVLPALFLLCSALGNTACESRPRLLTADLPLHLEDQLDAAVVTGSELPANPPQPVEWRFDQPQPEWKATPQWHRTVRAATLLATSEALRITLTDANRLPNGTLAMAAGIHVDLPDWGRGEWAEVVIRARADSVSSVRGVGLRFNLREGRPTTPDFQSPYQFGGQNSPIVRDGSIQTYRLLADWSSDTWTPVPGSSVGGGRPWQGPWQQLGLWFWTTDGQPGSIDLLSVSVVPKGAAYAAAPHGMRPVAIGGQTRRTLYTHAPARLSYRVRVPEGGRLDAALGVLDTRVPVTFRVTVRSGGQEEPIFEERYADPERWAQRSVDLSMFSGRTVTLALEASAERAGTVALWAAPTLSGARRSDKPNVILYIIDTGGADYMSVYGYNRLTTPFLEQLAAEGVVFEHAYSTSSWTKPSTASFMTSLHASVLGLTGDRDPVPEQALTMAERFHSAGYQTAVLTANPNASTVSGLERGVDLVPDFPIQNDATSSVKLHQAFWSWREASPGQPYWAHFQTTDVHAVSRDHLQLFDGIPVPPFGGLFVSPEEVDTLCEWSRRVQAGGGGVGSEAFTTGSVNRAAFYTLLQGMWDQQLAHNDYQLRRLIDRLKASGEWENTLLIVAADHSIGGAFTDTRIDALDPAPPVWTWSLFRPTVSRVPLIVVWPGHITGGRRFDDPVSLIDLLPTVLDLVGLPLPDVLQGHSLASLLLGRPGWTPRPVILEEVDRDGTTGHLEGTIEVVDGQWGASLAIGPQPEDMLRRRPWPLLLYDLWNDPFALKAVNAAHPDLVERYTRLLLEHWKANQALFQRFHEEEGTKPLDPEQLRQLRALGYIR